MNDPPLLLPKGYRLHEYRIDAVLGVGGFGVTYLATDVNLSLRVAVKEYFPGDFAARDADGTVRPRSEDTTESFQWGLQRFMDEAKTLASFRHPNIVRVMRFFQANRTGYMVMEFVEGKPLPEWIAARRPFPEAALVALVAPLLDGLAVVHKAGYLHRDIKPGNIFMRDDGSPVLIDFGSARRVPRENQDLTALVSPGYAPLEQYHARGRQGPWSDLYALGGVLYWIATANAPLDAAARVRQDAMPPARQAGDRKVYSLALLAAIDWALKPNEDERPQSVMELRAALMGELAAPEPTTGPRDIPFDPALMERMEADLARRIGPIAPMVVRTAARNSTNVRTLCEMIAKEISGDKERMGFLRTFASGEPPNRPVSQPVAEPELATLQKFSVETLHKTETQLARHIGPIAKVVVKRAAGKARDEAELYLLIAEEIEDPRERKAFVRMALAAHRRRQ